MITTILEIRRGQWWRWYLLDGRPYACMLVGPVEEDSR